MAKSSLLIIISVTMLSLGIGYFLGSKEDPILTPSVKTSPAPHSDQRLIELLLREKLGDRTFPFADVIAFSTSKQVIPYDSALPPHQALQNIIHISTQQAITQLNQAASPTKGLSRINEASRHVEDILLKLINQHPEFSCAIPKNLKGKEQRSGYPDLILTHLPSGTIAYLDPKLYAEASEHSSFRTFYYEPKTTTRKIQHDAIHFLLGIKHDGKDGDWSFTGSKIVDIASLPLKLKAEFQSSNKDIYHKDLLAK